MITKENIKSHEMIGLTTEITDSSNSQIIGLNGRIIDETKSMFRIKTAKGEKAISKLHNKWKFLTSDGSVVIEGSDIAKRSFDRIGGRI